MVCPGILEAVGEKFNGLRAFGCPNKKSNSRGTDSADQPKYVLHAVVPFSCWYGLFGCAGGRRRFSGTLRRALFEKEMIAERAGNATLSGMDSVRFGRALGMGARAAARTLATAVDAATAPNPSAAPKAGTAAASEPVQARETRSSSTPDSPGRQFGAQAARTATQVRETREGLKRGSKRFGEAVWGPFVKLSGVLWLEFTGVFFGIFTLFAAMGAWRLRGDLHQTGTNHDAHMHLLAAAAMALVFGYFCISSFASAARRGRRR